MRCDVAVDVFWAGDDSGDLVTVVRYDTDLFDEPTVTALFERFLVLLHGIADDPALPLSRLPLMTADERDRLVTAWNATSRPIPEPLPRLFADQVARTPARWPSPTASRRSPTGSSTRPPRGSPGGSGTGAARWSRSASTGRCGCCPRCWA